MVGGQGRTWLKEMERFLGSRFGVQREGDDIVGFRSGQTFQSLCSRIGFSCL